jgi:hypothetical protein
MSQVQTLFMILIIQKLLENTVQIKEDHRSVTILSQIYPVHNSPHYFPKLNFNIIRPSMPRSSEWFLTLRFPDKKTEFFSHFFHVHITCPTHLILLNLTTLIIFGLDRRLVWLWWGMLMPIGMPC